MDAARMHANKTSGRTNVSHHRGGSGVVPYATSPQRGLPHTPPSVQRVPRWVVEVFPPTILHDITEPNGHGDAEEQCTSVLLPLHSTLSAQISSIIRHFDWPSGNGVSLHLDLLCREDTSQRSAPGAMLTEESWTYVFGWALSGASHDSGVGMYGQPLGLIAETGLPIAARLEVHLDARKAKWFTRHSSTTPYSPPGIPSIAADDGCVDVVPLQLRRQEILRPFHTVQSTSDRSADVAAWPRSGGRLTSQDGSEPSNHAPRPVNLAPAPTLPSPSPAPDSSWLVAFHASRSLPSALPTSSEPSSPVHPRSDCSSSSVDTVTASDVGKVLIEESKTPGFASLEPAPPPPVLCVFDHRLKLHKALLDLVLEAQADALQARENVYVAVSSSLADLLSDAIEKDARITWQAWHVFIVDAAVPSPPIGSRFSRLASGHLHRPVYKEVLSSATISKDGLDSICDSVTEGYEQDILTTFGGCGHWVGGEPRFDFMLLDMGVDGRVGNLLPDHHLLGEHEWFVGWLSDAPEPPRHRITLTLPVINASRRTVFVVSGTERAETVADVLERTVQSDVPMEEDRDLPAALVKANENPVVWLVDEAAAAQTDYEASELSELIIGQAK